MSVALNISESGLQPGVFWSGRLPSDWRVKRLKFAVRLVSAKAAYGESDLPYMGLEHIESWTGQYLEDEEASPDGVVSHFEPGDVLFGKLRPYLAKVHLARHRGVCSTEALVLRASEELLPEYLRYFLVAPVTIEHINSSTYGSKMPRASWDFIGNQLQPLPPLDQQQKIAAFLDRKTAEIDTLIAKKRRLLDRLAEKRTALITRAVTKGLNPDAPMKDSGIEWLGEIPAHWDVIAIKWITPVLRGASPRPIDDPIYFDDEGEYSWVRIADVTASEMRLEKTTQRLSELGASLSVKRHPGDLFLSIAGSVGKPIIAGIKCCIHDGFVYFPRIPPELSEYLFWIFKSGQPYLGLGKLGTQLNLNTDTVGGIRIALPPADEVHEIVDWISDSVESLDEIHERISNAIARLEEYRSALITNAVTGQIKVA